MKITFRAIAFLLLAGNIAHAQLGYGPEAGLGLSTMHFAPDFGFTSASKSPIISGRLGYLIDKNFNTHIYYQVGLFFATKGQTRQYSFYSSDSDNDATRQTLHLYYLDLPANIVVKTGTQGRPRIFFGAGITFSYLLWGRNILQSSGNFNDTAFSTSTRSPVVTGPSTFTPFDLGINFIAGCELPTGLYLKAYYTDGIDDISKSFEIDKNRILGIAIGYLFGPGRNINNEADDLIDKGDGK